ncbi:hypothetical protein N0V88_006236 [Collariella sp. IMI 366227]|nr:hypothetical protein N0V88_006236 [Collariella sp. IMI 366227]
MKGLSPEDARSIIAIERACSALSFRAINRMVFYATFGNILAVVGTLMTTSYTHNSDAYWALAMAVNVYLTFYRKVSILVSMAIYIRAGREIYHKRRKMLNFSSTGTGTVVEPYTTMDVFSPVYNYKTTEVVQTTEIIQPPAPVAKPGTLTPAPPAQSQACYITTSISADAHAANQPNLRASLDDLETATDNSTTITLTTTTSNTLITLLPNNLNHNHHKRASSTTQISLAPPHPNPATTTTHNPNPNPNALRRRQILYEIHNATWSYTNPAHHLIPSSGNRVYSLLNHGEVSMPLFYASAFVLPLQGVLECDYLCGDELGGV